MNILLSETNESVVNKVRFLLYDHDKQAGDSNNIYIYYSYRVSLNDILL